MTSPSDARAPVAAPLGDDAPSGLGVAFAAQLVAFLAANLFAVAFLFDRHGSGEPTMKPGVTPLVLSLVPLHIGLVGGVIVAARRRRQTVRSLVGLRLRLTDPLFVLLGVVVQYAAVVFYLPFPVTQKELDKPARDVVDRAGSIGVGFWVLAVALVLVAPAVEELFYRGLVVGSLRRALQAPGTNRTPKAAVVIAVVLGAVWFAAIHLEPLQFPALLAVGVVCATLFVRTGRVVPGFFVHVGFNLVTVIELGRQIAER